MPHSSRSANASIRGYLYQTVLAAQAWVKLGEGETLVVEGDEDFDVVLRGGDGDDDGAEAQTSVQAKHLSDTVVSLATPSLQRAVAAFARIFVEKDGAVRFVYVTTQSRKAPEHGVDYVNLWVQGERSEEVASALADLAGLDKARKKGWKGPLPQDDAVWQAFVQSVRFEFDGGGVDEARRSLGELLEHDERCADLASAGFLPYRILDKLWDASSRDDEGLRRLTRHDLGELIEESKHRLVDWSRTEPAQRLVSWVDAAVALEKVLPTFTHPLTHPDLPSQLLDARYEVVPFLSMARAEEIETLSNWCDEDPPVAVKVIVGSGGTGKTRLLLELCKRCRAAGWHAGFLDLDATREQVETLGDGRGDRLVVVDYAETRLDVTRAVLKAVEGSKSRCRAVLLAREDGPWLESLRTSDAVLGQMVRGEPLRLQPLAPKPGPARAEAFRKMVQAFATARGVAVPDPLPVVHLDREEMESALLLAMSALEATRCPEGSEIHPERLLQATLKHEQRFWERWLEDNGVQRVRRRHLKAVEEAVSAASLLGRWKTEDDAEACLDRILRLRRSDPDLGLPLLADLAGDLYRGSRTGDFVTALQPDLLGEHLVGKVLFRLSDTGAWLEAALHGADSEQLIQAFTVLGRIGAELANAEDRLTFDTWLSQVLEADFRGRASLAFRAALGLCADTAFAPLATTLASVMRNRSPEGMEREAVGFLRDLSKSHRAGVSLRELGVVSSEICVSVLRVSSESDRAELAAMLNNLGNWQSLQGNHRDALESSREAVEIRRALADLGSDEAQANLALSLGNLANIQAALGDREAALRSSKEAVEIYRPLAEEWPDEYLPGFARSLGNLAASQSALGEHEAALMSSQETVEIRRQQADMQPDIHLPDLADSLSNLGAMQCAVGDLHAARESCFEAVEIHNVLAQAHPDAFLPDLARSLNNLGNRLSDLGEYHAALEASNTAVNILRKFAEMHQGAFLSPLAMYLTNLGNNHSYLGEHDAACRAIQEAVSIRRALAETSPDGILPDLARSLGVLGMVLSASGHTKRAVISFREALEIILPYAATLAEPHRETTLGVSRELLRAIGVHRDSADEDLLRQVRDIYGDDAI